MRQVPCRIRAVARGCGLALAAPTGDLDPLRRQAVWTSMCCDCNPT